MRLKMIQPIARTVLIAAFFLSLTLPTVHAEKAAWRQASDAELASLLPARAPVEKEHIETEMRTASGIVNAHGHFIAGVVLITAGYSADGKYSHYLIVQTPAKIGGISLKPGEYFLRGVQQRLKDAGVERISDNDIANWEVDPAAPDANYAARITLDLTQVTPHVSGPDT